MTTKSFLFATLGIFFFAVAACEPDEIETVESEVPQEESDEPEAPDEPDSTEGPRIAETTTPDDDELGVLPEGIGLEVGNSLPDVTVADMHGDEVNLAQLVDESAIMLVFYRGGWCPYCNFQIRDLTTNFEKFAQRQVSPVAISVDQVEQAAQTGEAYEIPFAVLSDPDLVAHEAFNVIHQADSEEVERLAEMGMDLEASSGRDHHGYAVPSIFLVSTDGEIIWAHAHPDYSLRPSIDQLLQVIDDHLKSQ